MAATAAFAETEGIEYVIISSLTREKLILLKLSPLLIPPKIIYIYTKRGGERERDLQHNISFAKASYALITPNR